MRSENRDLLTAVTIGFVGGFFLAMIVVLAVAP